MPCIIPFSSVFFQPFGRRGQHKAWSFYLRKFDHILCVSEQAKSSIVTAIGDSEYGILTPKDPGHIAEVLMEVLERPALRDHYAQKIKERSRIIDFDKRLRAIETLF